MSEGATTMWVAERGDESIEAITGRASLVAEMYPLVLDSDSLDQAAHALRGGVHLAEIAYLAATLAISDRNSIARLGNIDPDKNFCRMTLARPPAMRIGSAYPSNPRLSRVGRATSAPQRT